MPAAVLFESCQELDALITAGTELSNVQHTLGYSPLEFAVVASDSDLLLRLCQLGQHAACSTCEHSPLAADGWTPLHLAASTDEPQIVSILLAHGADIHAITRDSIMNLTGVSVAVPGGQTPLHVALANDPSDELIAVLLDANADPNTTDFEGNTPHNCRSSTGVASVQQRAAAAGNSGHLQEANRVLEPTVIIQLSPTVRVYLEQAKSQSGLGGLLWDSAVALSSWILANHKNFNLGSRVIELGCGLGLAGIVAAQMDGVEHVLMTDLEQVLPMTTRNVQSNSDQLKASMEVRALEWGGAVEGEWDTILCADVLYQETAHVFPELLTTITKLSGPTTNTLVAYCTRRGAELAQSFTEIASGAGMEICMVEGFLRDGADIHFVASDGSSSDVRNFEDRADLQLMLLKMKP